MKAVIWGYKYPDMQTSWAQQMRWVAGALQQNGVEVLLHEKFQCKGLEDLPKYNFRLHDPCDICIYNHADISHLTGNIIQVKRNFFFKPTVPDEFHATLDELGYGPYSSITYEKPPFESAPAYYAPGTAKNGRSTVDEVEEFFKTKVADWIEKKTTKWGARFENGEEQIPYEDYNLVLGQCGGDEVVTRHDFGPYFTKLGQVIKELSRVDERLILVKLHPYTDGEHAVNTRYAESLKQKYEEISPKVKVYLGKSNVHNFIAKARCVLLANSGAGFEVMMHSKPMITWGHPEYHWVTNDLRHLADLGRAVKLNWFDQAKQDQFLYWYMEKYCFYNHDTAERRVGELLNGHL